MNHNNQQPGSAAQPKAEHQIDIYHDDGTVTSVDGYTADQMRDAIAASRRAAGGVRLAHNGSEHAPKELCDYKGEVCAEYHNMKVIAKVGAIDWHRVVAYTVPASLPDVAMPEKIALVEASNALRLVRKYPGMDFIKRDEMLGNAIACVSKALAALPAEGSAQVAEKETRAIDALDGLGYTYDSEIGWLPPAAVVRAVPADDAIERAALKHFATGWNLVAHLIPSYRNTEQFTRLKAFALELFAAEGATRAGEQKGGM